MTIEERVENMQRLSGTDVRKCMKCGKCSGRCPAFKDMDIKPHQFVSLLADGKIEKLLECGVGLAGEPGDNVCPQREVCPQPFPRRRAKPFRPRNLIRSVHPL